jgi:glycerol-3-phosphate acyltransferase PlsX
VLWIAVDAMGGDRAPRHVIDGALGAVRHFDLGVALVGPAAVIEAELARHADVDTSKVRIIDAGEVVAMDESPSAALRRKPSASIKVAAETVARGDAAALFSAGHTGATVMAAHARFGMLPGVDRPALAAAIPTAAHRPAILLDVGASVECRPQHLLQFAVMGRMYARVGFGIESPRVGLLSTGEEATKGNELTREAHRLLKASSLSFIGNVEARDVYSGQADVIVCDGFTGNVALKISEGLVEMIETELATTITNRVGSLPARRALRDFRRRVDYSEYGGAPLVGVNGVVVVGHGRSSAKAVRNAVAMAYRFAEGRFIERLEGDISRDIAQEIAAACEESPENQRESSPAPTTKTRHPRIGGPPAGGRPV